MKLGTIILIIWILLGVIAAGQRGYYTSMPNCGNVGTIIITIIAGPLNWIGVNPKVACH